MTQPKQCDCPRARHRHGTRAMYDQPHACRCFPCRIASSKAKASYAAGQTWREQEIPTDGTRRRLQALSVNGWCWEELGRRLGVSRQAVHALAGGKARKFILISTAARVADLYDELWNVQPSGSVADRTRLKAARKGWLPPLAWDDDSIDVPVPAEKQEFIYTDLIDEIAVQEAISGRKVVLTRAELSHAVRKMTDMGYSADEIADRLGTSSRNVQRHRSEVAA